MVEILDVLSVLRADGRDLLDVLAYGGGELRFERRLRFLET